MEITTLLVSGVLGILASLLTAYITTRLSLRRERSKWERELAQRIAELGSSDQTQANRIARQFAVGYLIVQRPETLEKEKFFIPPSSRLSVGRGSDNDLLLKDDKISRHHAIFEVVDSKVFVVNLRTRGGVHVNGKFVQDKYKLSSGDVIEIGETKIIFHEI